MTRLGVAVLTLVAACALLVATASTPAAADPPRPTNFRSQVLAMDPPAEGVTVQVEGGDAFLSLTVAPGHTATVPDYGDDGAPYLRFLADGTVQVNEASSAHAANASRYGSGSSTTSDEPRWTTVGHDGRHAWHDHRIHLMVPDHLAVTDARGRVDLGGDDGTWEVPIVVDGVPTVVRGELLLLPSPAPWPWWALVAVTAGGVLAWAVGLRRTVEPALSAALAAVALTATWISATEHAAAPTGAGASWAATALAGVAAAASVTVLGSRVAATRGALSADRVAAIGRTGVAAATACLAWWAVARRAVLDHAVVPSGLPTLDRATTSLALGLALAAAVVLVSRPAALVSRDAAPGR